MKAFDAIVVFLLVLVFLHWLAGVELILRGSANTRSAAFLTHPKCKDGDLRYRPSIAILFIHLIFFVRFGDGEIVNHVVFYC